MLERRKYFISTREEYLFQNTPPETYLYLYKHDFPEIILRFPHPRKTITGYHFQKAQLFYHPFYQNQENQQEPLHHKEGEAFQMFQLYYPGQIILSMESKIFNQSFKKQIEFVLQQTQGFKSTSIHSNRPNKQHNQNNMHNISPIFKVLLRQWLNEPEINLMFLLSEKHFKSFEAYDHGFIQLQVLKTSSNTIKAPFHQYKKQREWTQYEKERFYELNQNKKYYFEFQASIFFREQGEHSDVQKLGFVYPRLLTTNQFFYEVLLMMFMEFQHGIKQEVEKKKREEEMVKNREALLQNLRNLGVDPILTPYNPPIPQLSDQQDSLDKKLLELSSKQKQNKNQFKNIPYSKAQQSFTSHFSLPQYQNESQNQLSPRRKMSKISKQDQDEPKKQDQNTGKIPRETSPTHTNIKVIRSFTSQIIEDDFELKPKRRFLTKTQFLKIIDFDNKVKNKRQSKLRKPSLNEETNSPKILNQKNQDIGETVFVGIKNTHRNLNNRDSPGNKRLQSKVVKSNPFVYDFFAVHNDTLIMGDPDVSPLMNPYQKDQIQNRSYQYQDYEDNEDYQDYKYNQMQSRNYEEYEKEVSQDYNEANLNINTNRR